MNKNISLLNDKLNEINLGKTEMDFGDGLVWIESHRKGPTGIGKTFEDLLGKAEDNMQLPDFMDIELKAHDQLSKSYITLFTKSPNAPRGVNTILRNRYGYAESEDSTQKILHTSVSSSLQFNAKSNRYFAIENDTKNEALKLNVYDAEKNLIDDGITAEWSYDALKKTLENKLKTLAIIKSHSKRYNEKTYYHYESIDILYPSLDQLLDALNDNLLIVDLRLGVYHSGKNKGKTHDHGTGFRIKYEDLSRYSKIYTLE